MNQHFFLDRAGRSRLFSDAVANSFAPWKMNLCAVSNAVPNLVFVATRALIQCLWLNPVSLQCTAKAANPLRHPVTHPDNPHFNHILVGHLGSTEVLVAADDAGRVIVWSTLSLNQPLALLSCPKSAWGISLHAATYHLAVSCNSHTISLWNFALDDIADFDQSALTTHASTLSTVVDKDPCRVLTGHGNNIPSIAFNADGSKLASVSIDHSCRVWDVQSGACITWTSLDQWGWQVQFVPSTGFFFDMARNRASAAAVSRHAFPSASTSTTPSHVDADNELLIATTQNQAYLLSLPPAARLPPPTTPRSQAQHARAQLISDLCMLDRVFPDRPRFYYLLQMTRISMLRSLLPALPLAVMANQVGQVGIVRLDMGYLDPPSPPPPPHAATNGHEEQDEQAHQAQVEADQAAVEDAAGGFTGWSFGNELPSLTSSDVPQNEQESPELLEEHGQVMTDEEDVELDEDELGWESVSSSSESDPLFSMDHAPAVRSRSRPLPPPNFDSPPAPILTHELTLLDRFPSITSPDASELPLYGLLVMPRKVVDPTISGEPQAEWPVYRIGAVSMDGSATWVDVGVYGSERCVVNSSGTDVDMGEFGASPHEPGLPHHD